MLGGFNKGYLCRPKAAREYLQFVRTSLYSNMADRGCDKVTIWKTTEPGDMITFGVTERYLEFHYREPDWDQNVIHTEPSHESTVQFTPGSCGPQVSGCRLEIR